MSTKNWIGIGKPGLPGSLQIIQASTGHILDADDDTFKAVPTTPFYTPVESVANPAEYSWSLAGANWGSDTYRWYWYSLANGAGNLVVSAMTLVDDEQPVAVTGLTAQQTRDAMLLAPTGVVEAGSIDDQLAATAKATDIPDTEPADAPGTLRYTTEALSQAPTGGGGTADTGEILAGVTGLLSGSIVPSSMQARAVSSAVTPRVIPRGDVFTLTFTLGAEIDISGTRAAYLCVKHSKTDLNSAAIINRVCTITDRNLRTGYITLTEAETAVVGRYHVEIEVTDVDGISNPQTAYSETWAIVQDVRQ